VKPRWLNILLAVSLAANAVEIAIPWWQQLRRMRSKGPGHRYLRYKAARYDLRVVTPEYQWVLDSLHHEHDRLGMKRQALTFDTPVDSSAVEQNLDSLEILDRQTYRLAFQSCQELIRSDDAKLRRRMEKRWRQQMDIEK
jgi:hypothetical protein